MRRSRTKRNAYLAKSLQELEDDYWGPVGAGETRLVRDCLRLRKVPLADLTDDNLRFLLGQQIGLTHLVPLALERLRTNPWSESLYAGDLLVAVLGASVDFWKREPDLLDSALSIARSAVQEWEHREGGPECLTGFRHAKKALAELERALSEDAYRGSTDTAPPHR